MEKERVPVTSGSSSTAFIRSTRMGTTVLVSTYVRSKHLICRQPTTAVRTKEVRKGSSQAGSAKQPVCCGRQVATSLGTLVAI